MNTCPNCGCRVYQLGCVNCDEMAYIDQQDVLAQIEDDERRRCEPESLADGRPPQEGQ